MNWDVIGAIGEVVGAIATLGTLIYIAVQIRQSSDLMKRQAFDSIATLSGQLQWPIGIRKI